MRFLLVRILFITKNASYIFPFFSFFIGSFQVLTYSAPFLYFLDVSFLLVVVCT